MRIFHKGLFLIAVPLAFQLVFLLVFAGLLHGAQSTVDEQLRLTRIMTKSMEVVSRAHQGYVRTIVVSILGNLMGRTAPKNAIDASGTMAALREDLSGPEELRAFAQLEEEWRKTATLIDATKYFGGSTENHLDRPEKAGLFNAARVRMQNLTDASRSIIETHPELNEKFTQERKKERDNLVLLMIGGLVCSFSIAIGLVAFASKSLREEVKRLQENSVRLGKGEELPPPMQGADELAHLDRVFNQISVTLRESRQREQAMFDNAADIIFSLDESGTITRINAAVTRLLHLRATEDGVDHLRTILAAGEEPRINQFLSDVRANPNSQSTIETKMCTAATASQNGLRHMLLSARWEPSQSSFYCVAHDITEKKDLEQAKQDFVAMLSHDLRSPLAALNVTFELIVLGAAGILSSTQTEIFAMAQKSISRLINMISELLDFEKLASRQMIITPQRVPLITIVSDAVATVRAMADEKRLVVEVAPSVNADLLVLADEERFNRVFINLLSNAIAFSPIGGKILVDAQPIDGQTSEQQPPAVHVKIIDQGPGIPAEFLGEVFQPYKQGPKRKNGHDAGTGLGLAICKQIIEAHGGTIGIESSVPGGTTIWFTISGAA